MATSPHSLAATAAMNAGIHNEETRRPSSGSMRRDVERARRRSSIRMNLNLNDPAIPAPGEMQQSPSSRSRGPWPHSPHHERAPSLGELHQELEYEQEGQVNRLLNMIRSQQTQINTLQANQQQPSASAVDDSTPTSERSIPATSRDESAFYQAETQNLTRENQMLKLRIRELERQLADQNPTSQVTHSPTVHSGLAPASTHENTDQGIEGGQPPASAE
ncbi:uncharacterized protein J4E92_009636 [Alternaria infectoria]|uniref:uncharacterized protein n=1 Tax=Alternaria infectoria TaxID=45303 RepID=UPI00221F4CC6|nr:uncharacterized protein J4E92_009636 [Alternaria infectoria]KAI4914222.1 hypothetical protein J4E92_009636 [Alternaria infectoria]